MKIEDFVTLHKGIGYKSVSTKEVHANNKQGIQATYCYVDGVMYQILFEGMEGRATNTPMAQKYTELSEEAKQFMREESEKMAKILPFCKCGKQLNLVGVCGGCAKGKEGYKCKFICECGYEEFFKVTYEEKIKELSNG